MRSADARIRAGVYSAAFIALSFAPFYLSAFSLNLLGQFLALAILAIGLDLIWGYTGILSLGQGVFFGLGGYAMAMYLKMASLAPGELPDFMTWSGIQTLPAIWKPFDNFYATLAMIVLVPGVVAGVLGALVFRSRIKGVYFSILTQALAVIAATLFVDQQSYTGGSSGLTSFKDLLGFSLLDAKTQIGLYEASLILLALAFVLVSWLCNSSVGKVLKAIRDGENRTRFCGYDPAAFKTLVFSIAAVLAAVAGALYVPQNGIIAPAMLGVVPSIEMVIWVAVGGRGTIIGAIIGALFVNYAKYYLSNTYPNAWLYFLGSLFVLVVLIFPKGIVGLADRLGFYLSSKKTKKLSAHGHGTESA